MEKKKLNLIIGAVIMIVGVFLALNMMNEQQPAPSPQAGQPQQQRSPRAPQYAEVVVAKKDIPKGSLVTEEYVKTKKVAVQTIGKEDMFELDQAIGKVSTVNIVVGERITKGRVEVKPPEDKLAFRVPDGHRAVTIPIDALASLEGMIKPGDRVDIIGTFPFQNKQPVVVPMFEDVIILATGRTMAAYASQGGYKSITMALKSNEAQILLFATQLGKLNLLLRSPLDSATSRVKEPLTMDKLWAALFNVSMQQQQQAQQGQQPQQPMTAEPIEKEPEIEIFSGGSRK